MSQKQVKFLRLIRENGVRIDMTQKGRENSEFQELVTELSEFHQDGIIPHFEMVNV